MGFLRKFGFFIFIIGVVGIILNEFILQVMVLIDLVTLAIADIWDNEDNINLIDIYNDVRK